MRNPSFPGLAVDIQLTLTVPADAEKAVPVIMELGFIWPAGMQPPPSTGDEPSWQEQVLDRGWGYAIYLPYSVQADYGAGLSQGIIGLMTGESPANETTGVHSAHGPGEQAVPLIILRLTRGQMPPG